MTASDLPLPVAGLHRILAWCDRGPSIVVARSTLRGRPWIRFVRRIGADGWHATAHRTLRAACVSRGN